jgi:hypothetical protein
MELSPEDNLRLNVLLANPLLAIRIDETGMSVHALTAKGEISVRLNPNCRDEIYLRRVRELISGQILGSPGGYPVYLKRWTRMGQTRDESLEQLLLLGEPEAVVAVVHAPGLTPELARRAWWAMPVAENARRMLTHPRIVADALGRELAAYLIEYLPFEEEPVLMAESVRLALQPGLIDPPARHELWRKGKHKPAYYLGFLWAMPDDLPEPLAPRNDAGLLQPLAVAGNPVARLVLRSLSAGGQTFAQVSEQLLRKPANQEIVNSLLDCLAAYYAPLRPLDHRDAEIEVLLEQAEALSAQADQVPGLAEVLQAAPDLLDTLRAMQVLARLSYAVVRPVFSRSSAIGSLMRKKLEPVSEPIARQLARLRGEPQGLI